MRIRVCGVDIRDIFLNAPAVDFIVEFMTVMYLNPGLFAHLNALITTQRNLQSLVQLKLELTKICIVLLINFNSMHVRSCSVIQYYQISLNDY